MTTRQPLGLSRENRIPREADAKAGNGSELKRALAEGAEQRKKRLEAEGAAEAARKDAMTAQKSVAVVRKELEKAKARIARRDETIASLKTSGSTSGGTITDFEARLNELVRKYQSSMIKYQVEIDTLKKRNAELETHSSAPRSEEADGARLAAPNKANVLAETENLKLKREVERLKLEEERALKQRHGWEQEKERFKKGLSEANVEKEELLRCVKRLEKDAQQAGAMKRLEGRIQQLEAEAKARQEELKDLGGIKAEKERLEELLEAAAVAYRLLYRDSVPRQSHLRVHEQLAEARLATLSWKTKAERAEWCAVKLTEDITELRLRMNESDAERKMLEETVDELVRQREAERESHRSDVDYNIPPLEVIDLRPLVNLAITNASLTSAHLAPQISELSTALSSTSDNLTEATAYCDIIQASLSSLQSEHAKLQSLHAMTVTAHTPCAGLETELRSAITRANAAEARQRVLLHEARIEISSLEERNRADRELLKRANDTSARAKAAEDSLADEVEQLREALEEVARFKPMYEDLQAEHEIVMSREAMALDEAARVGQQNVELMGRVSGGQKIGYMDALRREAAATKHELASTRHMLNVANDRIVALEAENIAYKSIDPVWAGSAGGSTRTRVRRQPEGSGLVGSTFGSSRTRSVSGR